MSHPQTNPAAPHVAIAGATGAVGEECLRVLEQRDFPLSKLTLLASARSAGKTLTFRGQPLTCEELTEDSFKQHPPDIALFSAGGSISKTFAPLAVDAGAVVIDNSSAFRMTPGVPLVVPEVNPDAIETAGIALGQSPGSIIANPNCSTIILLLAVTPLHRAAHIQRMVVSTYQAASGAGAAAMRELEQQSREALAAPNATGQVTTRDIFPFQYAFNLFSHNSPMQPNGYNQEELKMVHETHKIWNQTTPDQQTKITATCIRVPVMRAHAESINLTLRDPLTEQQARELLAQAPGVTVLDDREQNRFPTPLDATHQDDVFVGRIRQDLSQPQNTNSGGGLDLFVCGDQVRKGAALNAIQIAELLL